MKFQRNVFCDADAKGEISIVLNDPAATTCVFKDDGSSTAPDNTTFSDAAKSKRFLEYKALLRTYFLTDARVNIFDLLLQDILPDVVNPLTTRSFAADWVELHKLIPRPATAQSPAQQHTAAKKQQLEAALEPFISGLHTVLQGVQRRAQQLLNEFDSSLEFTLSAPSVAYERSSRSFPKPSVWLSVRFRNKDIDHHHDLLNEARLSAIAICLYFAAALETPPSDLRVLVLDDVLIGLDMGNRLPLLNILKMPAFKDHQVFLLTYDPVWFDVVQSRMPKLKWKSLRMFVPTGVEAGLPIIEEEDFLNRAKLHAHAKDYKAAAVYARSAFERLLKRFCEDKRLRVRFVQQVKAVDSNDLFEEVCKYKNPVTTRFIIDQDLKDDILRVRSIVLNPLSHAQVIELHEGDVMDAIRVIRHLETTLAV